MIVLMVYHLIILKMGLIYLMYNTFRSIWLCNNSHRQGVVADIMRKTRAKYPYSIRQIKKGITI